MIIWIYIQLETSTLCWLSSISMMKSDWIRSSRVVVCATREKSSLYLNTIDLIDGSSNRIVLIKSWTVSWGNIGKTHGPELRGRTNLSEPFSDVILVLLFKSI